MKILRTASLGSNFTGSYKKRVYYIFIGFDYTLRNHEKRTCSRRFKTHPFINHPPFLLTLNPFKQLYARHKCGGHF